VTDANGCESSCSITFEVFEVEPCLIEGPSSICEGATGYTLCGPDDAESYLWSPGDETTQCISLDGLTAGPYMFELTVVDENGCESTCSHLLEVFLTEPCEICGPTEMCEGTEGLKLCGPHDVAAYSWSPGGETTRCVSVDGLEPGVYQYELTVTDWNGCHSVCCWELEVFERPPSGFEGDTEVCLGDLPIEFCGPTAPSDANWEYEWTVSAPDVRGAGRLHRESDGIGAALERPTGNCFAFDTGEPGTFTVSLIVADLETGCAGDAYSVDVIVHAVPDAPERPDLDPNPACEGEDVVASWTSVSGASEYRLVRDGDEIWSGAGTSTSVPAVAGSYAVSAAGRCGNGPDGSGRVLTVTGVPVLLSTDPESGTPGQDEVQILGSGFWDTPRDGFAVLFEGGSEVPYADCIFWSDELISLIVPSGAETGGMQVRACGLSNALDWTPVEGTFYAVLTEDGTVAVRWSLESLAGVLGVNVYRATSPDGPFDKLNELPVTPASPGYFLDEGIWPQTTFWYELRAVFDDGSEDTVGASLASVTTGGQLGLALLPGRPNPFTDEVTLRFDLPTSQPVELAIYDLRGRAVRRLVNGTVERGRCEAIWDGRDALGEPVPSGVYFVRLRVGGTEVAAKLLLVR